MNLNLLDDGWVPSECSLPTEEQPLRVAEFDEFFIRDVVALTRQASNEVRFEVRPDPLGAGRAASLAVREAECCSFFRFELTMYDGKVQLAVTTADTHEGVLGALADRAEALMSGATP